MSRKRKGDPPERKSPAKQDANPMKSQSEAGRAAGEMREYTELVLLVHAANPAEAELFKTELGAHGIPAVIEGEGAGVAGIPDVGAGVPVLVPEEFADQAAELIAELESAKPEGHAVDAKENLFEDEEGRELDELDKLEDDDVEEDEEDEEGDEDDEAAEEEEEEEETEEPEEEDEDEDWDDDEEDWDDDDDDDL
jgi:hypothetical protein